MNRIFSTVLVCLLGGSFSGCYFNSAQHIFDKASYDAIVTTYGVSKDSGHVVYFDGSSYYLDAPRYRQAKPIKTQYNALEEKQPTEDLIVSEYRGTTVVEIPEDFAMYLMGKNKTASTPQYLKRVNRDVLKNCRTFPIVNTPKEYGESFRYHSSGAAFYYTMGVLDWLCVDLPITCIENTLLIPYGALYAVGEVAGAAGEGLNEASAELASLNASMEAEQQNRLLLQQQQLQFQQQQQLLLQQQYLNSISRPQYIPTQVIPSYDYAPDTYTPYYPTATTYPTHSYSNLRLPTSTVTPTPAAYISLPKTQSMIDGENYWQRKYEKYTEERKQLERDIAEKNALKAIPKHY